MKFEKATCEVIMLNVTDIVTTSGGQRPCTDELPEL